MNYEYKENNETLKDPLWKMRDNTLYSTTYNAFLHFCVGEFVEDEQEYENLNDTFNRKSSP